MGLVPPPAVCLGGPDGNRGTCPGGYFCAWVGAGSKGHAQVLEDAVQRLSTGGDMTICLALCQEVDFGGAADDRADVHVRDEGCVE